MPWPVSDEVIDLIKSQEENGLIPIKPPELRSGDRVTIKTAHCRIEWNIEKGASGQERVILLLTAIEYQARVVVDKAF